MIGLPIKREIKYQEELEPDFCEEIAALPGGEGLHRCMQCGTCSSTCPMSIYMDHTPRQIIAMTRAGFKDEVLASNTIWLCASCYSCTVDCPKQIKVTDVMYALKRKAIETKAYPRKFPIPVLAREFFNSVWRTGRSNEGRIVARMWLKTYPLQLLRQAGLGLKLLLRGRILIRTERMEGDPEQMHRLLEAVEKKRSALTVR
ncbi:MAG: 4Fe-4S dicluster domain-containing protein [Planctomycetota bacterium]|jgi:heterodisulfide reductase subunit C